jgi:hypothetical protein
VLHLGDLGADLLRRLRGLGCEALDLGCHHSEAAAGLPGPRRLDGGVERKQIGLPAISLINLTTSPIRSAAPARLRISLPARLASLTARPVLDEDEATWRLISAIEDASCSAALATVATLLEAWLDAEITPAVSRLVFSAAAATWPASASSSVAAAPRPPAISSRCVPNFFDRSAISTTRRPRLSVP